MDQPIITIFCAFTRRWAVERWIENLKSVEHDPARTNLAFLIDIDEPFIRSRLQKFADEGGYRKVVIEMNKDWHPNEVRLSIRRLRIADVKNQSKKLIRQMDGDIVVGFEDDTTFGNLDLNRLISPLLEHEDIAFVEGVQCGRWGVKMIGAWEVDDPLNPRKASTLLPPSKGNPIKKEYNYNGYQMIDAGGFYGYATRKELYLQHDYYSSGAQPYGPDVNYGLWLRQQGYKCYIDWETVFGHNDHNVIIYPDGTVTKITFTKDKQTGEWLREEVDVS